MPALRSGWRQRRVAAAVAATAVALFVLAAAVTAEVIPATEGGAVLAVEQPTLVLPPPSSTKPSTTARIGVRLSASAGQRVTAHLELLLPAALGANSSSGSSSGWAPADPARGLWLEPATLSWQPWQHGTKYVQLRSASELPLAVALQDALGGSSTSLRSSSSDSNTSQSVPQAWVQLAAATGAAVLQSKNATALVSGSSSSSSIDTSAAADSNLPLFGFVANQAAYPPEGDEQAAARIPVRMLAGRLREAATLRYSLSLVPAAESAAGQALGGQPPLAQFLPTRAAHGFLYFKPLSAASAAGGAAAGVSSDEQQQQWLEVPLVWGRIPPQAQYQLGLELEGVFNARTAPQPNAIALHIFGTPSGTCPPGTALSTLAHNESSTDVVGSTGGNSSDSVARESDPADGGPFGLSANGTVIDLSSSFQSDVYKYGAEVESGGANVTLCLRKGGKGFGSVKVLPAVGRNATAPLRRLRSAAAAVACGCEEAALLEGSDDEDSLEPLSEGDGAAAADQEEGDEEEQGDDSLGGACAYAAWLLPLHAGQNCFNITLPEGNDTSSNDVALGEREQYTLTVVQLAEPENAELESITVEASDRGTEVLLCGPSPAAGDRQAAGRAVLDCTDAATLVLPGMQCARPCEPGVLLTLNVSTAAQMVSLKPALRRPNVDGIRVEVNGQVLSRGGNLTADRLEDTTATSQQRGNASFLPSAFLTGMGLAPGSALDAEVVVVAEDGVTANRYPIRFLVVEAGLGQAAEGGPGVLSIASSGGGDDSSRLSSGSVNTSMAANRSPGWPLPPALQPSCVICPAGWAATEANSSACHMCPPGTHAPSEGSPACLACGPGTFAYSWGSSYCKACIEGTYAPTANSSLCTACPANTTTLKDGQAACNVPVSPGSYQAPRYAVVISFWVMLEGLDLDDVVVRAGVNLPPADIVRSLIRADTAASFNISTDDVAVQVHHVARRTLFANVTATLGVDVPAGATDEDISAAMEVERLSADEPIAALASDPDRFFGRTTRTLDVRVASAMHGTVESRPGGTSAGLLWGMLAPGILAIVVGTGLVAAGCRRSRACAKWRASAARRLATSGLAPRAQQYSRYSPEQGNHLHDSHA